MPESTHTCSTHLVLRSSDGLREAKEGQGQIDEAILVTLQFLIPHHQLVHLQTHQTHHQRGRRGDGWDDLTSNPLTLYRRRKSKCIISQYV